MSGPISRVDLIDVYDAIPLGDEQLFRARQALVAEIGIDEATLTAMCGLLHVLPLAFASARFDVAIQGVDPTVGVLIGALDRYEEIVDLIAWPLAEPTRLSSFAGYAVTLGLDEALDDPLADPFARRPLKIHRTAIGWLKAAAAAHGLKGRTNGVTPVDLRKTARALLDVDGRIEFEDDEHGFELRSAMMAFVDVDRFVVRVPQPEAA